VGFTGSVAAFTTGIFRGFLAAGDTAEMRIAEELVENGGVAGLTGVTADVIGG
jgi:hypothetical protein